MEKQFLSGDFCVPPVCDSGKVKLVQDVVVIGSEVIQTTSKLKAVTVFCFTFLSIRKWGCPAALRVQWPLSEGS